MIVALSIFAVGGGVSIYEGVARLRNPTPLENPLWNYAVLGFSFVFESASWYFGWQAFSRTRKKGTILEGIHASKDPTTFSVLLEDSTAIAGLLIAFAGISLGHFFDFPYADGIASILIGLLLCAVAWLMGYETKELIIGEAVDAETLTGIRQVVEAEPKVEAMINALTTYIGSDDVALGLELRYAKNASSIEINRAIRRVEKDVRAKYPAIKRIFYAAGSLSED